MVRQTDREWSVRQEVFQIDRKWSGSIPDRQDRKWSDQTGSIPDRQEVVSQTGSIPDRQEVVRQTGSIPNRQEVVRLEVFQIDSKYSR